MTDHHPARLGNLLIALVALLMAMPLASWIAEDHPKLAGSVISLVFSAVLLLTVLTIAPSRRRLTLVLAAVPLAMGWLAVFIRSDTLDLSHHLTAAAFLAYACCLVLKHVVEAKRVTIDLIAGALCIYLLLGILWAYIYSALPGEFLILGKEGSLKISIEDPETSTRTIYYSFVTLLTLGFGDIVPKTMTGRMCTIVEALMGQVVLVVLVARLVGMHSSQTGDDRAP